MVHFPAWASKHAEEGEGGALKYKCRCNQTRGIERN